MVTAEFHQFTDIHVKVAGDVHHDGPVDIDIEGSLLYPGAHAAVRAQADMLYRLVHACRSHRKAEFNVQVDKVFFRVFRDDYAVDGTWYRFRRMADEAPTLDTLRLPLHRTYKAALMSEDLQRGGLVLVVGKPGSGKTTTASATIVSRLEAHGGVAFTVEDPAELPLNGRHGKGYCTQREVAGATGRDWVESMRGILRSQPVGTHLMLLVGEIRDAEAARTMLRAASNGFLVVSTSFATDVISGIDSIFQMVGDEYASSLAESLRIVLYQHLVDGRLTAEMLMSESSGSRVATIIRSGRANLAQLKNELQMQRNQQLLSASTAQPAARQPMGVRTA